MTISSSDEMNGYGVSQLREGTMMQELGYAGVAGECEPRLSTESRHVGADSSGPRLANPGID
jgi:hypothetical protein